MTSLEVQKKELVALADAQLVQDKSVVDERDKFLQQLQQLLSADNGGSAAQYIPYEQLLSAATALWQNCTEAEKVHKCHILQVESDMLIHLGSIVCSK